jgi:hypothetical protein
MMEVKLAFSLMVLGLSLDEQALHHLSHTPAQHLHFIHKEVEAQSG